MEIGIISLVGNPHRSAAQLPEAAIFTPKHFVLFIAIDFRHDWGGHKMHFKGRKSNCLAMAGPEPQPTEKISRKAAKTQRFRPRKQNSREKAQKTQKENVVFNEAAVSSPQIELLTQRPRNNPHLPFLSSFAFLAPFVAIPTLS